MLGVVFFVATCAVVGVASLDGGGVGRILTAYDSVTEFTPDVFIPVDTLDVNDIDTTTEGAVATSAPLADAVAVLGRVLEDRNLRRPMTVVVDNGRASLERAVTLLDTGLRSVHNEAVVLTLLPYMSTGLGPVYQTVGSPWFRQVLHSLSVQSVPGVAYYSVLKATEQVPIDGAILLFTARAAVDEDLAQLTASTLASKRCKLYVFWCGGESPPGVAGPEQLYREVAAMTGGQLYVAYKDAPTNPTTFVREHRPIKSTEVILAVRRGIVGNSELSLKVDSTVHALNIVIDGQVSTATLRAPPPGDSIDLLSEMALRRESSGRIRVVTKTADRVELQVNTSDVPPGTWMLGTSGVAADRRYNVTVTAVSRLSFSASIQGVSADKGETETSLLRLTLVGVGDIAEVSLVDENGQELKQLTYQRRDDFMPNPNGHVTTDLDLPSDVRSTSPIYVKISGQDPTGADFTRVSLLERQIQVPATSTGLLLPVSIELGANSTLNILPNYWAQIVFEVTNNRNEPTMYYLGARDEKGYVRNIQPTNVVIGPLLTANVAVHLMSPAGTPYGTIDTLTLIVTTRQSQRLTKSALITIGDRTSDSERPNVWHSIKSDCSNFLDPSTCQSRVWSTEITIEDRHSGLLRVTSIPRGIQFRTDFVAGTKSAVMAYYSATCCETRVDVTATDALGNYVKYSINADSTYFGLTQGEVAAVSLGSIVLILLIVIIVLVVCICRNRKSRDLPVRSRSTR